MGKYFGTDGMRGIPNVKLTVDIISKMGVALDSLGNKDVVIATDTRISKDMLTSAIASGALSHGMNVHFIGVIPTPALIYYSKVMGYTGVMITASHNPYTDNGIKLLNKGYKLTDLEETRIEELMDNPIFYNGELGRYNDESNAINIYLDFIEKHIIKTNLKIAIDCANGATYKTAPIIFSKVTDNLIVVANNPDGYNINNNCGSTHLDLLKKTVVENKCDLGFAFDGDGDRVLCVDECGNIVDGDMLVYLISKYLKSKNKLNKDTIVLSIMSNLGLLHKLSSDGIKVVETPVGDKYVIRALIDENLSIGGENSGHIIVPEVLHTGDGVLNSLLVINLLIDTKTSINDWFKDVKMYADKMVNIKVNDKNKVLNNKDLFNRIEDIKKELNNDCKIIVRPSGTEDLIRVSVMTKSNDLVERYSNELVNLIKSI